MALPIGCSARRNLGNEIVGEREHPVRQRDRRSGGRIENGDDSGVATDSQREATLDRQRVLLEQFADLLGVDISTPGESFASLLFL